MQYIVYLDEFGHIGPYFSRDHARHNDSPVFGLAGFAIPARNARGFGTWFFKRKKELLAWEINASGKHPAVWEKKGSALYTAKNVAKYKELRQFTFRFMNQISKQRGFVIYVGVEKDPCRENFGTKRLYLVVLKEIMKRLNRQFNASNDKFLIVMDEHQQRSEIITEAALSMYGGDEPTTCLIEPPFQVESHRYQTLQAADWISGLVGRLGALEVRPDEYVENEEIKKYFEERLVRISIRSGIRRSKFKASNGDK